MNRNRIFVLAVILLLGLSIYAIAQQDNMHHMGGSAPAKKATCSMQEEMTMQGHMLNMMDKLDASFARIKAAKTDAERNAALEEHGKVLKQLREHMNMQKDLMTQHMGAAKTTQN